MNDKTFILENNLNVSANNIYDSAKKATTILINK